MTGRRLLALFLLVVVLAIGAGLYVLGSPSTVRGHRLDARRVSDLRSLAAQVDLYWTRAHVLPADLAAIEREAGMPVPQDPVTNRPYGYRPLGTAAYELCTAFEFASLGGEPPGFWSHPAGEHCYRLAAHELDR